MIHGADIRPATTGPVAALASPAESPWTATGPVDAPAIVFLHGAIVGRIWGRQVRSLRAHYRCVTVDLPGHGRSRGQPFDLDRAVRVVSQAIDSEAAGRAVLVGLSMGGYVAMAVAARRPEAVRGIVVADASLEPRGLAHVAFMAYGWLLRLMPARLVREVGIGLFRRAYGRDLATELADGYDSRAGGTAVLALAGRRFRAGLRAYGGPVLVLNGARDRIFRRAETAFVTGLDQVTVRHIPGAGHLSNLDRPEAFTEAVAAFMAALPDEPPTARVYPPPRPRATPAGGARPTQPAR